MANTSIATSDARTVKQYQQERIAEYASEMNPLEIKGFIGEGSNFPICKETDLSKGKGDQVTYYLEARLTGSGVYGDNTLRYNEEAMVHYEDSVKIDQVRHGIVLAGRMTEQRTRIKLRKRAKGLLGKWGSEWMPEMAITMLSGARGTNSGKLSSSFTGFAGNTLTVPDSSHLMYGGSATSKASVASTDKYDTTLIEKFVTKAETLDPQVAPLNADGENMFIGLLHSYQARDLRINSTTGQWLDLQKAATTGGAKPKWMTNALGAHAGVVLHKSQWIRTFSDYGAGSNVAAARALFLGCQAGVVAYGEGFDGGQWDYQEIKDDYANQTGFGVGMITGFKPCIFNSQRFGMIAADTAAAA